jgi:hypothetical protein
MGTLRFQLPAIDAASAAEDLERSYVAGGYDNMPTPTRVSVAGPVLTLDREVDESGFAAVPLTVAGVGRLLCTTSTLIERIDPYSLSVELARGKVNQLRCQEADWRGLGMVISEALEGELKALCRNFGVAISRSHESNGDESAYAALSEAFKVGRVLVDNYVGQIFKARHSRQGPLESLLGVRINGSVPPTASQRVVAAVNCACLPLTWRSVEPTESNYRWEPTDTALAWAERNNLAVTAGPLIDFAPRGLPDWLWLWEGDLQSLASFMCDYVETAVGRYRGRIRRWQLTAGANIANILKLSEDDFLWLTARLAETAWQVDPELEISIGISQPWGEYMARQERTYSPYIFADTLIRAGLKLAALDLEWIAGVWPRGSYCRDVLEASRNLDLYAMLGIPLQISLGIPATTGDDQLADATLAVNAGHWSDSISPDAQADWAEAFATLALAKPCVRSVTWTHLTDGEEHAFPNCGLLDPSGRPRPALARLEMLRTEHLR